MPIEGSGVLRRRALWPIAFLCGLLAAAGAAADDASGSTANFIARVTRESQDLLMRRLVERVPSLPSVRPRDIPCIQSVKPSQLTDIAQSELLKLLGAADLRASDEFFTGPGGEKWAADVERNLRQQEARTSAEINASYSDAEKHELDEFFASPAGKKISEALRGDSNFLRPIIDHASKLAKACVDAGESPKTSDVTP